MSLSSFRVHQARPDSKVVPRSKNGYQHPPSRVRCRMSLSSFRVHQARPDSRVVPRSKNGYQHPPSRVRCRMSLSSFRVHQDVTGQQSSASTEKMTNTHRRADAVGCHCHRSACPKTRPESRVVTSRKNGDEPLPPRGCGRMSLSSFRMQPDANGQQSSASTEKR
ncbi:hypothetical protein TNCV_3438601 [Trichonephila clavipes]|nr:hypothetical protein TNCV_3438601 [Trichonephila clavipes]